MPALLRTRRGRLVENSDHRSRLDVTGIEELLRRYDAEDPHRRAASELDGYSLRELGWFLHHGPTLHRTNRRDAFRSRAWPRSIAASRRTPPTARQELLLLPPRLREWLPDEHLAWLVLDAVAEMDLAASS
jgi:hypothetical protein